MAKRNLVRVRFKANAEDYRSVNFPVPHPYWCTGSGGFDDNAYNVVVTYADADSYKEYVNTNWPETVGQEFDFVEPEDDYKFSSRFPKPDWFSVPDVSLSNDA